jgi:flagellar biosynthesis GTPase FlhF
LTRNHPDRPDDPLLASAIRILSNEQHPFTLHHWRTYMPKALATTKNKALKAAEKKASNQKPKHVPSGFPANPFSGSGIDTTGVAVVHSNQDVDSDAHHQGTTTMTEQTKQEKDAIAAQAKIAAKAEKQAKADAAKAEKAAAAEAKKAEAAARKAAADAERAAKKQAAAAERANKPPRERTYTGSMLALSERAASGVYVKGANGQLRATDEVAIALDAVPAKSVVPLLIKVLGLESNPYPHLNYGQQSMNLRNRLRGALKAGTEVNGVKITLDHVKGVRDEGGYATAA